MSGLYDCGPGLFILLARNANKSSLLWLVSATIGFTFLGLGVVMWYCEGEGDMESCWSFLRDQRLSFAKLILGRLRL